jgi:hypothetical protein
MFQVFAFYHVKSYMKGNYFISVYVCFVLKVYISGRDHLLLRCVYRQGSYSFFVLLV